MPDSLSVIWKVKPAGPLRGAPTIAFGGVYVISQDNQIIALNAANGAVLWQATASLEPGSVFGAASPAAGQGTIVAGYSSGEVQAYRYENGRDLWEDALARTSMALSVSTLTDVDDDLADLEQMIGFVDEAIGTMTTAASNLGAIKQRTKLQGDFVSALMTAIDQGVGALVDADMNEESTKLQALQVQQQLGIQALSIANQNSQMVLSLFR